MGKKRITYVDLFRAAGIIAMIMGHINFGWHFDHLIHGFHMPMFFFVSGFFYRSCDNTIALSKKMRSRCRSLLLPYIIFAFLHIAISSVLAKHFDIDWLRLLVFNTDKDGLPIAGALWFLTSLFFADHFYMILDFFLGCGARMHFIIIAAGLIGNILGIYLPFRMPFGIDTALVGMVFIHFGRILHQDKMKRILELDLISSLLLLAVGISLIMANQYVNLRWGRYGIIPVFWMAAVITIISGWNLSKIINKAMRGVNTCWYIYILNIGRDSIVYLCLNQLVILISFSIINIFKLSMWPTRTCVLVLVFIILEGIRKLLTDTKLKVIVGQ